MTYAPPKMTTNQEVFDFVVRHLHRQGIQSFDDPQRGMCAYRGSAGRMCAVGCLVADEHYHQLMEGTALHSEHPVMKAVEISLGFSPHELLLQKLQIIHDNGMGQGCPKGLMCVADCLRLDDAVIHECWPDHDFN